MADNSTIGGEIDFEYYLYEDGSGLASTSVSMDSGAPVQSWVDEYANGYYDCYCSFYDVPKEFISSCSPWDNAGNMATMTVNVTVVDYMNGPVIDEFYPFNGSVNTPEIDLWFYFHDNSGTMTSASYSIDGGGWEGLQWFNPSWGYGETYIEGLSIGNHTIEVRLIDDNGDSATYSINITVANDYLGTMTW